MEAMDGRALAGEIARTFCGGAIAWRRPGGELAYVMGPSPKEPGRVQVTTLAADCPLGDRQYDDAETLITCEDVARSRLRRVMYEVTTLA